MLNGSLGIAGAKQGRESFITRCCGCKRFRDGAGIWVRLIAFPANADFSDGICVPCIRARYPLDIAERVVKKLVDRGLL